ncbi:MAG: glutaredoxin [Coprococcus sp.]
MLKVYGSSMCEDTVACIAKLNEEKIAYEFIDITKELPNLKVFLSIRDKSPLYDGIRENGGIGIPCIEKEDGSYTLDWESIFK